MKTAAVKKLSNTYRKNPRIKKEVSAITSITQCSPPTYLDEGAKAVWDFAISQIPEGLITSLDLALLTRWCVAFNQYQQVYSYIKRNGVVEVDDNGKAMPNRFFSLEIKLSAAMREIEREIGFTPASRTRISASTPQKEEKNEFLDL